VASNATTPASYGRGPRTLIDANCRPWVPQTMRGRRHRPRVDITVDDGSLAAAAQNADVNGEVRAIGRPSSGLNS
jgi:hypothetical protein